MLQGIADLHPLQQEPLLCLADDERCLQVLTQRAQAVIYATGANGAQETIAPHLPANTPVIEYLHTPDSTTYQRIRQALAVQAATSRTAVQAA